MSLISRVLNVLKCVREDCNKQVQCNDINYQSENDVKNPFCIAHVFSIRILPKNCLVLLTNGLSNFACNHILSVVERQPKHIVTNGHDGHDQEKNDREVDHFLCYLNYEVNKHANWIRIKMIPYQAGIFFNQIDMIASKLEQI